MPITTSHWGGPLGTTLYPHRGGVFRVGFFCGRGAYLVLESACLPLFPLFPSTRRRLYHRLPSPSPDLSSLHSTAGKCRADFGGRPADFWAEGRRMAGALRGRRGGGQQADLGAGGANHANHANHSKDCPWLSPDVGGSPSVLLQDTSFRKKSVAHRRAAGGFQQRSLAQAAALRTRTPRSRWRRADVPCGCEVWWPRRGQLPRAFGLVCVGVCAPGDPAAPVRAGLSNQAAGCVVWANAMGRECRPGPARICIAPSGPPLAWWRMPHSQKQPGG